MMLGIMRIRNEARWIERVVKAMLPVCDGGVLIMDDHSTDGTREICAAISGVTVFESPFEGLQETRDKNYLLAQARTYAPEWILFLDGDELLAPGSEEVIQHAKTQAATAFALQVLYLWDTEDQVRMDGIYSRFWRPSMFRLTEHQFQGTNAAGGFHCGNAPIAQQMRAVRLQGAPLLHFGYMHREDRVRKWEWYCSIDGGNPLEDQYRHVVVGDVFPADSVFRHGGPLKLEAASSTTPR